MKKIILFLNYYLYEEIQKNVMFLDLSSRAFYALVTISSRSADLRCCNLFRDVAICFDTWPITLVCRQLLRHTADRSDMLSFVPRCFDLFRDMVNCFLMWPITLTCCPSL